MTRTLRGKIIFLALAVSVVVSLTLGVFSSFTLRNEVRKSAIDGLAGETRLVATRVVDSYRKLGEDALSVSNMPPAQGFIRSISGEGHDLEDNSTIEQWRARLETIFISIMELRPYYTQMRFIGVAENGRELVRVNRSLDDLVRVAAETLQSKGGETYFTEAQSLQRGQVYYSDVTHNRELGEVDAELIPTMRALVPVFGDGENSLFGFIAINCDYPKFMQAILEELHLRRTTTVVTSAGDITAYDIATGKSSFFFHSGEEFRSAILDFRNDFKTDLLESSGLADGNYIYYVREKTDFGGASAFLDVALSLPSDQLFAEVRRKSVWVISIAVVLTVLAALIAARFAYRMTEPLTSLTEEVSSSNFDIERFEQPMGSQDEVGELARAFRGLLQKVMVNEAKARESILSAAPNGILSVDEKGEILMANEALFAIFGYESDELIGRNLSVLVPQEHHQSHGAQVAEYASHGEGRKMAQGRSLYGIRKDGTKVPVEIGLNRTALPDGASVVVASVKDITQDLKAQESLNDLIEDLKHSNHELDQFAYVASHDLKAPLRVIDNASRWLSEDLEDILDEDSRENLEMLRGRVQRMERLLDDLLEYSRIGRTKESGSDEMMKGEEVLEELVSLLPTTGFTVESNATFKELVYSRMPLLQILYNLTNNAIKHHDKESGSVVIAIKERADDYYLTVTDDGPGIDPQFQEKIFEMFQTLKPRDRVEGSGMGLAIIRKHLQYVGCEVSVESTLGSGCTFSFNWPKDKVNCVVSSQKHS